MSKTTRWQSGLIILGHTGRLGSTLYERFPDASLLTEDAASEARRRGDARAYFRLAAELIARLKPSYVLNCLGYTDVDRAENDYDAAMYLNAYGPGELAGACTRVGARLVHFSTDFVFDGTKAGPYSEEDEPAPLSVYGKSKLRGEQLVYKNQPEALIIRCSWFFGPGRPGFVDKVVAKAQAGHAFGVVTDQIGSPTYTADLADAVLNLLASGAKGLVHVANAGAASRFELAREALHLAGLDPDLISPARSSDFPIPATRPTQTALSCRRYTRLTGRGLPDWRDALSRYILNCNNKRIKGGKL